MTSTVATLRYIGADRQFCVGRGADSDLQLLSKQSRLVELFVGGLTCSDLHTQTCAFSRFLFVQVAVTKQAMLNVPHPNNHYGTFLN